jgi:Tfp pilus assembly protein PilN
MIKINFLTQEGVPTTATEAAGPGLSSGRLATLFLVSLLASLALSSLPYWFWSRQLSRVGQDLAVEQREAARLAAIQAENQRFQQRVNEAERRLDTVHNLLSRRVGPVALMTALGEMVNRTTGLYLLTANAEGGRLVIQGQSDSVEALANFVGVLRRSGSFADVQFHQFFQDDQEKRVSFKFNVDCVYQPPVAAPGIRNPESGMLNRPVSAAPVLNRPATAAPASGSVDSRFQISDSGRASAAPGEKSNREKGEAGRPTPMSGSADPASGSAVRLTTPSAVEVPNGPRTTDDGQKS